MNRLAISLISVSLLLAPSYLASASDGCGFGRAAGSDGASECQSSMWTVGSVNDGFTKYTTMVMEPDTDVSNEETFNTLTIRCEKKKIRIFIFMDGYIDTTSFDFTQSGSLIEYGKLALKLDNGKIQKWDWKRRFSNQIELSNPDKLMPSLVKAKTQFSFKISREDAPSILVYPKSDMLKHRTEFAKSGCKY
jgi:hypothetical protein